MELTPKIPHSIMQYGAPLGRKEWNDNSEVEYKGKLYLRHIPLDSGGYDAAALTGASAPACTGSPRPTIQLMGI